VRARSGVLVLATVVAALSGSAPARYVPDPPGDPDTLVLRVDERPGFGSPLDVGALPWFSLYGGGRPLLPDERGCAALGR
jgi:hypothetical protein